MKSLNIIFLTRSYYPNVGGVEKHIYEISKRLSALGHHVTIITEDTRREKGVDFNFSIKNVNVIEIPVGGDDWFKKFRIWKWIWQHKKLFLKSDVIHCHDVFFWYLPLAVFYPLKNVYTTFHGYESYPIKKKAIIYRKVFEYMSNSTICVGDFMKKWYHARPTMVIYGAAESMKGISKLKKNTAIFIGRLDEHTGIADYVDAVKLIRKEIPSFTLTVYGDGPYKDKINGPGIILKGYDTSADKEIAKYEFAFVSRYLAILEAMAAKRRVVAVYDNPVKKDYLTMTPFREWISICSDAQSIAKEVVEKNGREKSVQHAFAWVKDQTWEHLSDVYLSLWNKSRS